nr:hypothetical protein [Kibdelosporangium sp. MJ126-NF4]CEL13482.1 hypothetical protein [Kibdelosporangium sp. MJ126-NF4]CTQ99169.1 hypothetical protein [Kibdelosporangium sp. MJ126-NF4]
MLHRTAMTAGTRADLNAGEIEIGDVLDMDINTVDVGRDRITVRELNETQLADAAKQADALTPGAWRAIRQPGVCAGGPARADAMKVASAAVAFGSRGLAVSAVQEWLRRRNRR